MRTGLRPSSPDPTHRHPSESLVTGDTDYLLRVVARDIGEYERFLKTPLTRVTAVRTIRSRFALSRAVYKAELPLELVEPAR